MNAKDFYIRFIEFLKFNYKQELIRNDLKTILSDMTKENRHRDAAELAGEFFDSGALYTFQAMFHPLFLYAFFLEYLGEDILPYLAGDGDAYDSKTLSSCHIKSGLTLEIKEIIKKLTKIIIPKGKKIIKASFIAPDGDLLSNITEIIIEEGIEIIELEAFENLPNLKDIYLPASLKHFGDFYNCNDNVRIHYKPVLKENGKKGVGFKIKSFRPDAKEWFTKHLVKY